MKREIIKTTDGSTTIRLVDWEEQYHSKHGAIQEAYHVFIDCGLAAVQKGQVAVLEMGFGTGLNALITLIEADKRQLKIDYTAVEAYPVLSQELEQLNFISALEAVEYKNQFELMHSCPWEASSAISPFFGLKKIQLDFRAFNEISLYDLVYFDAFGARVQPELWTEAVFKSMFVALKQGGILVTYSAKGSVRRAMQAVGFIVERLPGPPGKREMLRATKPRFVSEM